MVGWGNSVRKALKSTVFGLRNAATRFDQLKSRLAAQPEPGNGERSRPTVRLSAESQARRCEDRESRRSLLLPRQPRLCLKRNVCDHFIQGQKRFPLRDALRLSDARG